MCVALANVIRFKFSAGDYIALIAEKINFTLYNSSRFIALARGRRNPIKSQTTTTTTTTVATRRKKRRGKNKRRFPFIYFTLVYDLHLPEPTPSPPPREPQRHPLHTPGTREISPVFVSSGALNKRGFYRFFRPSLFIALSVFRRAYNNIFLILINHPGRRHKTDRTFAKPREQM